MSKRAAKLTLVSTGIVSRLLLILYLPVLIWSPPWGEKGYYIDIDGIEFGSMYFANGQVVFLIMGHNDQKKHLNFLIKDTYTRNGDTWESVGINGMSTLQIKNNTMTEKVYNNKSNPKHTGENIYIKSTNPFSTWHSIYLEWASEELD